MAVLGVVTAALAPGAVYAGSQAWTSGGPEGGLIRTIVIDPRTADVVYAVTPSAGVFKSTTAGSFWTPVNNGLTSLQVGALAVDARTDPNIPTILYAGTAYGGLFKSTNGGLSWFPRNGPAPPAQNRLPFPSNDFDGVTAIVVDPKTPTTVYVGTGARGIFKSVDAGETWSRVLAPTAPGFSPGAPVSSLAIDPVTPATVYAGTLDRGAFKSTDGGGSWNPINNGLPDGATGIIPSLAINPLAPSTLYATTFGKGIYRTVNGGLNWTPANTGLVSADQQKTVTVTVDPRTPSTLYMGTLAAGVFRSLNSGDSWSQVVDGFPAEARFVTAVAVDPRPGAASPVYAGLFGNGVFKSTNGGVTWAASNTGLGASFMLAVAADRGDPAVLYGGTYRQKLYKSTNGGRSWTPSSQGLTDPTVNVLVSAPPPLFGGGAQAVYAGTSEHSVFLSAASLGSGGTEIIGPPGPGGVFKSPDSGASWTKVLSTSVAVQALAFDPIDGSTIYAGTLGQGVFRTTNGGLSWDDQKNLGLGDLRVFSLAVRGGAVYAGTGSGAVFKSTNGGASWSPTNAFTQRQVVALASPAQQLSTVYAATFGDGVYKTVDGGNSWNKMSVGLFNQASPPPIVTVFALAVDPQDPNTVYAGTFDAGVFKTTNGGQSWTQQNAGLPGSAVVHGLATNPAGTCLHAGTGGSVYDFAGQPSAQCPPPSTLRATLALVGAPQPVGGRTMIMVRATIFNDRAGGAQADALPDTGDVPAIGCGIAQLSGEPIESAFQAVNAMDQPIAAPNVPVTIPPDQSQGYLLPIFSDPALCPADVPLAYDCTNTEPAPISAGKNTIRLSGGACGLSVTLSASRSTFVAGQILHLGGSLTNSGVAETVDFYLGILKPDNVSVDFLTNAGVQPGNLGNLASFKALATGVSLADPFSIPPMEDVFPPRQWSPSDPGGSYVFFLLAVRTGTLAGPAPQIIQLATASYSFSP